jgi:omega-hydroxy-beta-dihydromenaquinone-9 sulfotransferase
MAGRVPTRVVKPVFFVGMPRSGTTLTFAAFASHPDLAWFSQYLARAPRFPVVTALSRLVDLSWGTRRSVDRQSERRPLLERGRFAPAEAYEVWERCCGRRFRYDFLLGEKATEEERRRTTRMVQKVLRYQGKPRFAAKLTGPGRIAYLTSVFGDARFVHVVRDGRAVVESLMRVGFWKDTDRMREPAWAGGLSEADLARWRQGGGSPVALAAMQWRAVLETTRAEAREHAPDRYAEVRYEDFVRDPHDVVDRLLAFCELRPDPRPHAFIDDPRLRIRDLNEGWRERLVAEDVAALEAETESTLHEFGYAGAHS